MNPILNLAWRGAKIFRPTHSVSDALAKSESVYPLGVVLHYNNVGRSVLIFHDTLRRIVEASRLSLDDDIIRTGLLDILGQGQMIVHQSIPALTVTRLLGLSRIHLAFVIDDEGTPLGLFSPTIVHSRLPNVSRVKIPNALSLEKMMEEIDLQMPNFHSERVNYAEYDVLYCNGGHVTDRCPCPEPGHAKLGCGSLKVAT